MESRFYRVLYKGCGYKDGSDCWVGENCTHEMFCSDIDVWPWFLGSQGGNIQRHPISWSSTTRWGILVSERLSYQTKLHHHEWSIRSSGNPVQRTSYLYATARRSLAFYLILFFDNSYGAQHDLHSSQIPMSRRSCPVDTVGCCPSWRIARGILYRSWLNPGFNESKKISTPKSKDEVDEEWEKPEQTFSGTRLRLFECGDWRTACLFEKIMSQIYFPR